MPPSVLNSCKITAGAFLHPKSVSRCLPVTITLILSLVVFCSIGGSLLAASEDVDLVSGYVGIRSVFAEQSKIPVYELNGAVTKINIAQIVRMPWSDIFVEDILAQEIRDDRAPARSISIPQASVLAGALLTPRKSIERNSMQYNAEDEGFFNLWKVNELRCNSDDNVAVVAFDIESKESKHAAVGIGCDYGFAVINNGHVVGGRIGHDDFRESSDLLPLELHNGRNEVTIIFETSARKAMRSYFNKEWIARIDVFADDAHAIQSNVSNHNRVTDCQIVFDKESLRTRVGYPFFRFATLYSVMGKKIITGAVGCSGQISWEPTSEEIPKLAMLSVDERSGEPVLFTGGLPLDGVNGDFPANDSTNLVSKAWTLRSKHLMKPEYTSRHGDAFWGETYTRSLAAASNPSVLAGNWPHWYSTMQLGAYVSKIDGSTQYFEFYEPRLQLEDHSGLRSGIPLIVILPTVPDPVRPFLEGMVMAGQREFENWCAVADEFGCALLWPGFNEVDYGGCLSQVTLRESLENYLKTAKTHIGGLYLLGTCSAGVTAVQFAAHERQINGVMLYSPILQRRARRYTPGMKSIVIDTQGNFTRLLPLEDVATAFRGKSCSALFDSGMEGHGDLTELKQFVRLCHEQGVEVQEVSAGTTKEFVWGERMKYRLRLLLSSIDLHRAHDEPNLSALPAQGEVTIKNLLISGFVLGEFDPSFGKWLSNWEISYAQWRGAALPRTSRDGILVRGRVVTSEEAARICAEHNPGYVGCSNDKYFGIRLVSDGTTQMVDVFQSPGQIDEGPRMDPLLDCECKGLIFKLTDHGWSVISIW